MKSFFRIRFVPGDVTQGKVFLRSIIARKIELVNIERIKFSALFQLQLHIARLRMLVVNICRTIAPEVDSISSC